MTKAKSNFSLCFVEYEIYLGGLDLPEQNLNSRGISVSPIVIVLTVLLFLAVAVIAFLLGGNFSTKTAGPPEGPPPPADPTIEAERIFIAACVNDSTNSAYECNCVSANMKQEDPALLLLVASAFSTCSRSKSQSCEQEISSQLGDNGRLKLSAYMKQCGVGY